MKGAEGVHGGPEAAPVAVPPRARSAGPPGRRLPSIARRLGRALLANIVLWTVAVSTAVWLAVRHEVFELMDDALQATAQAMSLALAPLDLPVTSVITGEGNARFAWQVVDYGDDGRGRVVQGSPQAPREPLRATPSAGHADAPGWRVYGAGLGHAGRMLYVAQSDEERLEVAFEVALNAALATLAVVLLAYVWLGARARRELAPLERLSERLATHDLLAPHATLGPAEREELQPVHTAIDTLAAQLSRRLAHERLVAAHAAHALRTPLAGIDAQLAVALREAPPALQPRLRRAREAATRLQRVVAALLALFRSGVDLQPRPIDLGTLAGRLPVEGLRVTVDPGASVHADPDLLAAALVNLLDNALRHGARNVTVSAPAHQRVHVVDDGPGVSAARRDELQRALDAGVDDGRSGLGLRLSDRVARAHGGRLRVLDGPGFGVELALGADGPASAAVSQVDRE